MSDGELPGMWEEADLSGGAADTEQVVDGLFFPPWVNSAGTGVSYGEVAKVQEAWRRKMSEGQPRIVVIDECVTQDDTAAWKAFKEGNYDIQSGKVRRHPRTLGNRLLDALDNLVVRIQRKRDKRG